jgi:hypothetical protein
LESDGVPAAVSTKYPQIDEVFKKVAKRSGNRRKVWCGGF